MKSTREIILNTLLTQDEATISELADMLGINGISVRHHLINLQNEGLIVSEEQRHGVGRPRFVFRLTEKGLEKFPTNYLRLTSQLIGQITEMFPSEQVSEVFRRIGKNMAEELAIGSSQQPLGELLDQLSRALTPKGYRLAWEQHDSEFRMINYTCPYHLVCVDHPEVCQMDRSFFAEALHQKIFLQQSIQAGMPQCIFVLKANE